MMPSIAAVRKYRVPGCVLPSTFVKKLARLFFAEFCSTVVEDHENGSSTTWIGSGRIGYCEDDETGPRRLTKRIVQAPESWFGVEPSETSDLKRERLARLSRPTFRMAPRGEIWLPWTPYITLRPKSRESTIR